MRKFLETQLFLVLRVVLRLCPWRWADLPGRGLGWLLFHLHLRRRSTLEVLRIALGEELDSAALQQLAKRCYMHFGGVVTELITLPHVPRKELLQRIHTEGMEHLWAAHDQGRGVLLVGGHLGNWEWFSPLLHAFGFEYSMYIGPQSNPQVDAQLNAIRLQLGTSVLRQSDGVRKMLRFLRARGVLGMLPDQHFSRNRYFVPFFGRPCSIAPGVASIHRHTGAPMLVGTCLRTGRMRYRIRFQPLEPMPPSDADAETYLLQLMSALYRILEREIRAQPEQYLWMHSRWRALPTTISEANRRFLATLAETPGSQTD